MMTIDWSWEVRSNEMFVVVRRVEQQQQQTDSIALEWKGKGKKKMK
jgi:hypothetical protein